MLYTVTLNPAIDYVFHTTDFTEGELNYSHEEHYLPGGKGINVSRILAQLGTPSTCLGFIGGFTGEFILKSLETEAILQSFTSIEGNTRINLKMKGKQETEINGEGPHITEEEQQAFFSQLNKVTSKDLVILSGSLPKSLPDDFYEQIISVLSQKGTPFVIDTSGEKLFKTLSHHPLLIKPNKEELSELFQTNFESNEAIIPYGKQLIALGAQHVIVSLGGEGALLFTSEHIYYGAAPKGTLVNSVGAGDSLIAGFVSSYSQLANPLEAFKLGLACGSATAFSTDLAKSQEIKALLPTIQIAEIKRGWDINPAPKNKR